MSSLLLWFCFTEIFDWLAKLALLSQQMRRKTTINQSRLVRTRFSVSNTIIVTCIYFEFRLVYCIFFYLNIFYCQSLPQEKKNSSRGLINACSDNFTILNEKNCSIIPFTSSSSSPSSSSSSSSSLLFLHVRKVVPLHQIVSYELLPQAKELFHILPLQVFPFPVKPGLHVQI